MREQQKDLDLSKLEEESLKKHKDKLKLKKTTMQRKLMKMKLEKSSKMHLQKLEKLSLLLKL